MKLTQEYLKSILDYNPDTGIFTWKVSNSNRVRRGDKAGRLNNIGYISIGIDNREYLAHRLAFLYVEGYFPEHEVDHINRIRNDNRWDNLRHVSKQCNLRNCNIGINNTSGVVGISLYKKIDKWHAYIAVKGKRKHLGYFEELDDAVFSRWEAEKKYNYPSCNSTSTAYNYLKERCII